MKTRSSLYIGLMSGTSMDAIDAALVDLSKATPTLIHTYSKSMPSEIKSKLIELCQPGFDEINRMGEMDHQLGMLFASAALELLKQAGYKLHDIEAIGSHGQTIRHQPKGNFPFTLQIGDPNIIAEQTQITTVSDFRRRDMAASGQGAPLAPVFHQVLFHDPKKNRVIVNIGGIANITLLDRDRNKPVIGFDTGPGNTLLDAWIQINKQQSHDKNGEWAREGNIQLDILETLLEESYFAMSYPKSTGREYFNLTWLQNKLNNFSKISPIDIQTTLVELTAKTIIDGIKQSNFLPDDILVCGGGAYNSFLMERLQAQDQTIQVTTIQSLDYQADWIEAMAFAWLAHQTLSKKTGNLPSVTGASRCVILGGIYSVNKN